MTWNLQGSKHTDLDRVAATVSERSPDVLLVQEIRQPQSDALADRLDLLAHWAFKHHPFAPFLRQRAEGAAIMTPHALDSTGSKVISAVTSRRHWKRRIVTWGTVTRADASSVRVLNLHLSPHDLRDERLEEAARVSALAAEFGPRPPILLGGDFNDHGEVETLERLPGVEHVPSPPTNPAHEPVDALDHILLPADVTDVALEVPAGGKRWDRVSDHLPVTVTFQLP